MKLPLRCSKVLLRGGVRLSEAWAWYLQEGVNRKVGAFTIWLFPQIGGPVRALITLTSILGPLMFGNSHILSYSQNGFWHIYAINPFKGHLVFKVECLPLLGHGSRHDLTTRTRCPALQRRKPYITWSLGPTTLKSQSVEPCPECPSTLTSDT